MHIKSLSEMLLFSEWTKTLTKVQAVLQMLLGITKPLLVTEDTASNLI